jgi:hypothetical protein
MFAQQTYRPEIARVAEETVLNLKQLESRIEVLKNDLAALCTVIGHPEAARVAVTPTSWLGVTQPHLTGSFGSINPLAMVNPQFGLQGFPPQFAPQFGQQGVGFPSPYGSNFGISPYASFGATPFGASLSPIGISPPFVSPYQAGYAAPFGSPLTQGIPAFR